MSKTFKGDPTRFITFADIFTLALAKTKTTHFLADSLKWYQLFYDVCEKYREKIPELEQIFFKERPPLPPLTGQFWEWVGILMMCKLAYYSDIDYKYIVMEKKQKKQVRELEEESLKKYKPYIKEISQMIEKHLAVNLK